MDRAGASATPDMLRATANSILERNHNGPGEPKTVGKMWPYRFIENNPRFFRKKAQAIEPVRIEAWDLGIIETYYDRLRIAIDNHGVQKGDFYNMDETNLRIALGKDENIITLNPEGKHYIPSSSSRKSLTAVECISADGFVLKPLLILPGVQHMEDWYTQDLPPDYLIATSPTGYTSDEIALEWIKHFDRQTKKRRTGPYRVLLMDNHGSHLTYEFLSYCDKNKIIVYCFPPHTTHMLQPLDGLPFRQPKHFHGKKVNTLARLGCRDFDTRGFLAEIDEIRRDAFKPSTILSAFQKVGLFPWNPRIIMDDLEKKVAPVPDLHGFSDVEGDGTGATLPP